MMVFEDMGWIACFFDIDMGVVLDSLVFDTLKLHGLLESDVVLYDFVINIRFKARLLLHLYISI